MKDHKDRPARHQCLCSVRIAVAGESEMYERYAENLSSGGMFVRDDNPPPVGSLVAVEFGLSSGVVLCRVVGRVIHARKANIRADQTAGMGIQFVEYDAAAQSLLADLGVPHASVQRAPEPSPKPQVTTEVLRAIAAPGGPEEGPVIGIDFGTTNTCAAVVQDGQATVITTRHGYETVPSVVYVTDDHRVLAGHGATHEMILYPERTVYGFKRFIGRPFQSREVKTFSHFFNYGLAAGKSGRTAAVIDDAVVPLEVVAAYVLAEVRKMAAQHLGTGTCRCVITVPAYFGEMQRQSIRDAARLAGLQLERLVSEPTAAAVAYGYGRGLTRKVLVYDFGGGTFDASLLQIDGDRMEVLAAQGDPFLGGSDFDDRLTGFILSSLEDEQGLYLREDAVAVQRVRFAVEMAKKQLSECERTVVDVPHLAQTATGPFHLHVPVDQAFMDSVTAGLVRRTLGIVRDVLTDASLTPAEIDAIVFVGGQSRSPNVKQALQVDFGDKITRQVHPDHAVAIGAAIIGGAIGGNVPLHLTDILPASIRMGRHDPRGTTQVLLRKGVKLPVQHELLLPCHGKPLSELLVTLYRGEAELAEHNELLGQVRFPSSMQRPAPSEPLRLLVRVSRDGVLTVVTRSEETCELFELSVSLTGQDEVLEVDNIDVFQID